MPPKAQNERFTQGAKSHFAGMSIFSGSKSIPRDGVKDLDISRTSESHGFRLPHLGSKNTPSAASSLAVHLPSEILVQIISYIPLSPSGQKTLYSCCLLSRQWYAAAISKLYEKPYIDGPNFEKFTATICPPLGSHLRHIELASYVKHLDLSRLVHHSSKSLNARLLGRVKNNLETFRGPVASFGTNCLAPISKSERLRGLDLSLICEPISICHLMTAVSNLQFLEDLRLPRSTSIASDNPRHFHHWPPNLESLQLSGCLPTQHSSWSSFAPFPSTLNSLTLDKCTDLDRPFLALAIAMYPNHVTALTISPSNPILDLNMSYYLFQRFDGLRFLSIPANCLNPRFLITEGDNNPLETLELAPFAPVRAQLSTSLTTMVEFLKSFGLGMFPNLRQVRVHESLAEDESIMDRFDEFDTALKASEAARRAAGRPSDLPTSEIGVFYYE